MWSPRSLWIAWLTVTLAMAAYLTYRLRGADPSLFLPGATSHGHYQIELACHACHEPFGGVREQACLDCHAEELQAARDSHPRSKFTDPRNADRLQSLDAAHCVTCHREHVPEQTRAMGVTLPDDYCFHCHQETVKERASHRDYPFDSCATSGCHNYHDNTALYEDFLARHLDEPDVRSPAVLPVRHSATAATSPPTPPSQPDVPAEAMADAALITAWSASAHAASGVGCTACHRPEQAANAAPSWSDRVDHQACTDCHREEVNGFLAGRHGMRLAQGLSPLTPAGARLPMLASAAHRELSCVSCHEDHGFDTRTAAVNACLGCHNDDHSRNYLASPHYALWQTEVAGLAAPGSGVSCASCHLPRETISDDGETNVRVVHNQNANLRPNEKMLRTVCLACHGLGFSLDALADPALVRTNFTGRPSVSVESLDLVRRRRVNPMNPTAPTTPH